MRALALGLVCVVCAACGAMNNPTLTLVTTLAPVGFSFTVQNLDGPPVLVAVNGAEVGRVTCDDLPSLELTAGQPGLPPLPWVVTVSAADGTVLDTWTMDGSADYVAFIRRYGTMLEQASSMNPGPGPMRPCPSMYFDTPPPG